jgi:hypothetical protein
MKNWYDGISDEMIEKAKANNVQQCLLGFQDPELAKLLASAPDKYLWYYSWATEGWDTVYTRNFLFTYRLRPDWERPDWERPEPKWWERMDVYEENRLINNVVGYVYLVDNAGDLLEEARKDGCIVTICRNDALYKIMPSESKFVLAANKVYRLNKDWREILKSQGKLI